MDDKQVRHRQGLGRWQSRPREDVREIRRDAFTLPQIVGSHGVLTLRSIWGEDQILELAKVLAVPFIPRRRRST